MFIKIICYNNKDFMFLVKHKLMIERIFVIPNLLIIKIQIYNIGRWLQNLASFQS